MKTFAALLAFLCLCLAEEQLRVDISQIRDSTEPNTKSIELDDAAPTLTKQICEPDLHSLLKDMSSQLAKQRLELSNTKMQLQTLETRLKFSESISTLLDKAAEKQGAVISKLEKKQEQQTAVVEAFGSHVSQIGSKVKDLIRETEQRRVSFSATLLTSGDGSTGPFEVATPLVYKRIISNIGNSYDSNTGAFTAPVRGIYSFHFTVYGDKAPRPTAAALYKNGNLIVIAYSHPGTYQMASNGASVLLEVGDKVQVKLWPGAWVYGNAVTHPTSFSGHLLFLM